MLQIVNTQTLAEVAIEFLQKPAYSKEKYLCLEQIDNNAMSIVTFVPNY